MVACFRRQRSFTSIRTRTELGFTADVKALKAVIKIFGLNYNVRNEPFHFNFLLHPGIPFA